MGRPKKQISTTEQEIENEGVADIEEVPMKLIKLNSGAVIKRPESFTDIFSDVGAFIFSQGFGVDYRIVRNGAEIGTHAHPMSIEALRKRFGGGNYQVEVRVEGQMVARKSFNVEAMPEVDVEQPASEKEETGDGLASIFTAQHAPPPLPPPQPKESLAEMMTGIAALFKVMQPAPVAAPSSGSDSNLQLQLAQMQQASQKEMLTLIVGQMRESQENTKQMFKTLADELKELRKAPEKNKNEDMSALALIKLKEESEDKGYKRAMEIYNIAEKKAEERIREHESIKEDLKDEVGDEIHPKSTMDRLIEGFFPLLARLPMAGMAQPTLPAPARVMAPRPAAPVAPGVVQPKPVSPTAQVKVAPKASVSGGVKTEEGVDRFGLPTMHATVESELEEPSEIEEKILSVAIPELRPAIEALIAGGNPPAEARVYAARILKNLESFGIAREVAVAAFSRENVLNLVESLNLPEQGEVWLNSFYDCFSGSDIQQSA